MATRIVPDNVAAAMRQTESSGNYSALGPVVQRGSYRGQRAYGAYQVMEGNIGPWTEAALGRRMTPQEFLNSPAAQDAVFDYHFGRSMQQYGNYRDAASIWHSGRSLERAAAAGATDGYMATVDYVDRVTSLAEGRTPISPRAQAGYTGDAMPTDAMPSMNDLAGGVAGLGGVPQLTATQLKQQQFVQDLQALANLRQQADVTTQRRQAITMADTNLRSVARHTQALQSGVQPLQVTATY